jgi:Protein of unknown function (DUF3352)
MKARAALALAALAAFLAVGCGGGGGTSATFTGPDPASVTPSDAPIFAEAVVRPEGDQKDAVDSALSKLLANDDPGSLITDQLDQVLEAQSKGFTYEADVAPWLGPRAGIFFNALAGRADGAIVLSVTNTGAAQQAIAKAASTESSSRKGTYKGVDYTDMGDGTSAGLIGDLLVTGPKAAFEAAVDASQGSSLAESSTFATQLASEPSDQLAFAYLSPRTIVDQLEQDKQLSADQVAAAGPQLQTLLSQPVTMSASASDDQVSLETSAATSSSTPAPEESSLLRDFPSDSWLAFGASQAGRAYGQALAEGGQAAVPSTLGLDLSQISKWAGDLGGYVRGTSLFGLGGALVVQTSDEQASAETLDQLRRVLSRSSSVSVSSLSENGEQGFSITPRGAPIQIQFVQRDGKVVVGLGSDSVNQVFSPSSTLGDSDVFKSATDALGSDFSPVALIDFVPLFQLVDSFPQAAQDPSYLQAKPYLDHLDYLILGGHTEGGRGSIRMVLGLRDAPSQGGTVSTASAPAAIGASSP